MNIVTEQRQDHATAPHKPLLSLAEIAAEALRDSGFQDFIRFVLRYVINTLGADMAVCLELEVNSDRFRATVAEGHAHTSFDDQTLPAIPESLAMRTLTRLEPVAVNSFNTDHRYEKFADLQEQRFQSAIAVAIAGAGNPIGALCLYFKDDHSITPQEISYLQSVAAIVAMASEKQQKRFSSSLMSQTRTRLSRNNLMGELGTHIAHEVSQPLTALMNYLQSARRLLNSNYGKLPETIDGLIEKTLAEAERASSLVRQIRDYLEPDELHKSPALINALIKETCEDCQAELARNRIRLDLHLQESIPPVPMDRLQIQQVLINILRHSMESSGSHAEKNIRISSRFDGNEITVALEDSGPVQIDTLDRKFRMAIDLNKSELGFGLAICKSIIEAHGGRCWFTRLPQDAVLYNFTLPLKPADPE